MRITLASLFGSICGFGLIDSKLSIAANIPSAIEDRQFISSDGIKLHYLSGGQGEQTLVFIPGWLMPAACCNKKKQEAMRALGQRQK